MADNDLSLTFSVDSDAAVDGVSKVNAELEKTAADAAAATDAAKGTGAALADGAAAAAPALTEVSTALQETATQAGAAADAAKEVGPALAEGVGAAAPALAEVGAALEETATQAAATAEAGKAVGPALAEGTSAAVPALGEVSAALDATATAAGATAEAGKEVGPALAEGTAAAVPALGEVSSALQDTAAAATDTADAGKTVGPALSEGVAAAVPALAEVSSALADTATAATATAEAGTGVGTAIADGTIAAIPALQEVTSALDGTAASATAAADAAGGVGSALVNGLTPAVPAVDALAQGTQNLKDRLDTLAAAMANPTSGPRVLFRDAATAQMALSALEAVAKTAGVTLESLGINVKAVHEALLAAATRSATFTTELGKLRAEGVLAANQLQALRGGGTSLSGMFESMYKTGGDAGRVIGSLGISAGIASMAFIGAEAAGNSLSKTLLEIEAAYSKMIEKQRTATTQTTLYSNVTREVIAGHVALGKNLQETILNYDLNAVASGKAATKAREFADELKNIKPPQGLHEATVEIEKFASGLEGAMKKGPEEAAIYLASMKDFETKITALFATLGKRLPEGWQNIVKAQKEAVAAQKLLSDEGAKDAIESYAKIIQAAKQADEAAALSAVHSQGRFEAAMKQLNQEELSSEEYSKKKAALYAVEAAAQDVAVAQQAVADAKAEVAEAELQKKLGLSNIAYKDVAKAASDYAKEVASGVSPSDALAKATGALEKTIEDTKEALPQLNENVKNLWEHFDSLAAKLGILPEKTEGFSKQVAAMTKMTDAANKSLTTTGYLLQMLADKFPVTGTGIDTFLEKLTKLSGVMGAEGALLPLVLTK